MRNLRNLMQRLCLSIIVASAIMLQLSLAEAQAAEFKDRLMLIVEEGDTIFLVPPPPNDPIGTSGVISRVWFGPVGTFETGLLSEPSLVPFLIQVITTGSAIAGPVAGTFTMGVGEIQDEHTAWLTLSPEEPRFADELGVAPENVAVIIVTAEGVITGGSGHFRRVSGNSKLYLKVEVPTDLSALPIARTGQFLFEFD